MLDTIKARSPEISKEAASAIERLCVTRVGIENRTEQVLYSLCSGSLKGSYESSVSARVDYDDADRATVRIEGSLHKAIMGHNVYGGPCDLQKSFAWLVRDLEERIGHHTLPAWEQWECMRVDWTEVYDLGSYEGVTQYLRGLGLARYPRRQVRPYGNETVMFPGTTSTLKFYHKGPEFAKNGHRILESSTNPRYALEVQRKANTLLRVELSVKAKKLKSALGEYPKVGDLDVLKVAALHDLEVARVLKEGQSDMEWVRTHDEVEARLFEVYGERLATALFGTWLRFAAQGEDRVRARMARRTYYLHKRQLAQAGIAWDSTDVYIREESLIPDGFRPVRSDPRRLTDEAPEVKEAYLAIA